jgi:hypothetical protein
LPKANGYDYCQTAAVLVRQLRLSSMAISLSLCRGCFRAGLLGAGVAAAWPKAKTERRPGCREALFACGPFASDWGWPIFPEPVPPLGHH